MKVDQHPKRIFVRGLSRSGGTLLVTVLDAHPDVAMSYEIYEHLLAPAENGPDKLKLLIDELSKRTVFNRQRSPEKIRDKSLHNFVIRAMRSGIEPETVLRYAKEHRGSGSGFLALNDRMRFVESLALEKMNREGKRHWGTKHDSVYEDLFELFPDAYFLFMQRDGRDMAASRKLVGNFSQTMEHIAETWVKQNERFARFAARPSVKARIVHYERLVDQPESELRGILNFLGLDWHSRLLQFHVEDLTIYQSPMGHLSADQVTQPINTSSVGRWKRDLTVDEVATIESIAGPSLMKLGYETSQPVPAADG